MSWVEVEDYRYPGGWPEDVEPEQRRAWYCKELEQGEILFFNSLPYEVSPADVEFLLSQRSANSRLHKNVSFRPQTGVLRGFSSSARDAERMKRIMSGYSASVTRFLSDFLAPYAAHWVVDFASFRPLEEAGRDLPFHKRNDLLHVDAFPSRPTQGGRILRVFSNIHPDRARIWLTTDRFPVLAQTFAMDAGLKRIADRSESPVSHVRRGIGSLLRKLHVPVVDRSPYDKFMLGFHDYLKENARFQDTCPAIRLEFPPMSTWIVFTDGVPHAALSGQFALEQTYIIPQAALLVKGASPLGVLEALAGRRLSS